MGTINKGIRRGFSGKVGTVIGGTWKGIDYMRSKSDYRNTNPSEAQLAQQLKFGLCIRFVSSMNGLVERTFGNYAIATTSSRIRSFAPANDTLGILSFFF